MASAGGPQCTAPATTHFTLRSTQHFQKAAYSVGSSSCPNADSNFTREPVMASSLCDSFLSKVTNAVQTMDHENRAPWASDATPSTPPINLLACTCGRLAEVRFMSPGSKFQLGNVSIQKHARKLWWSSREWMLHTITGSSVACTLLDTCTMSACMPELVCVMWLNVRFWKHFSQQGSSVVHYLTSGLRERGIDAATDDLYSQQL